MQAVLIWGSQLLHLGAANWICMDLMQISGKTWRLKLWSASEIHLIDAFSFMKRKFASSANSDSCQFGTSATFSSWRYFFCARKCVKITSVSESRAHSKAAQEAFSKKMKLYWLAFKLICSIISQRKYLLCQSQE